MKKFIKVFLVLILFFVALGLLAMGPLAQVDLAFLNFKAKLLAEPVNQFILGPNLYKLLGLESIVDKLGLQNFTAICSFISGIFFSIFFFLVFNKTKKEEVKKVKIKNNKKNIKPNKPQTQYVDSIKQNIPEPSDNKNYKGIKF